jgi:hypothetical protein
MNMTKAEIIYFILVFDFIIVLLFILFINFLEYRYKEYAHVYDIRNVEMRDFTVIISNLPPDYEYGGKEMMLQAQLWNHIELTIQKAFEDKAVQAQNWEKLDEIREERPWEITDITFAYND